MDKEVRIIVNNPMFVANGKCITVLFEDGETAEFQGACPAMVLHLANKYNVGKIYIKGNKLYNKKLVKEIQEEENLTYRDNILEFEFIK